MGGSILHHAFPQSQLHVGIGIVLTNRHTQLCAAKHPLRALCIRAMVTVPSQAPAGSGEEPGLPEPEPDFEPDESQAWVIVDPVPRWASFVRRTTWRIWLLMRLQLEQELMQQRLEQEQDPETMQMRVASYWALFSWGVLSRPRERVLVRPVTRWTRLMRRILQQKNHVVHHRSFWGWAGSKILRPAAFVQAITYAFRPRVMPDVTIAQMSADMEITSVYIRVLRMRWKQLMTRLIQRRVVIMQVRPWWGHYGTVLQRPIVRGIVRAWFPHDDLMRQGLW